jgi:hypothetical protein
LAAAFCRRSKQLLPPTAASSIRNFTLNLSSSIEASFSQL